LVAEKIMCFWLQELIFQEFVLEELLLAEA